jgi:hypothetical protein
MRELDELKKEFENFSKLNKEKFDVERDMRRKIAELMSNDAKIPESVNFDVGENAKKVYSILNSEKWWEKNVTSPHVETSPAARTAESLHPIGEIAYSDHGHKKLEIGQYDSGITVGAVTGSNTSAEIKAYTIAAGYGNSGVSVAEVEATLMFIISAYPSAAYPNPIDLKINTEIELHGYHDASPWPPWATGGSQANMKLKLQAIALGNNYNEVAHATPYELNLTTPIPSRLDGIENLVMEVPKTAQPLKFANKGFFLVKVLINVYSDCWGADHRAILDFAAPFVSGPGQNAITINRIHNYPA